jgi:hypothetical protein
MYEMRMTRRLWRALAVAGKREQQIKLAEKQQRSKPIAVPQSDQWCAEVWAGLFFAGPQLFAGLLKKFAS